MQTGSGSIIVNLAGNRGSFTDSRLETSAGDIVVYIPDDLGLNIRAAAEMARTVRSDFPDIKISHARGRWGTHEIFAEGSLNGGGPLLHVHTTKGSIEFKRKKEQAKNQVRR